MTNYSLRSWNEVPAELVQYILQEVNDRKAIFECQRVCKSWKGSAERVAYQTIKIPNYNLQLRKLLDTVKESRHLGKYVTHIDFSFESRYPRRYWDQKDYFKQLSDYCPNVKAIKSKPPCYWLWKELREQKYRWENLQEIPRPFDTEDMYAYSRTARVFRNTLSNLTLELREVDDISFFLFRNSVTALISDLSTFTRLKHLEIKKPNGLRLEEVDVLLDSCPNLISLAVHRRNSLMMNNAPRITDTENSSLGILDKINTFKPKINLRKFDFTFTTDGGDETLEYITHAMPNIHTLHLNMNFHKTDVVCGSPVIVSFLVYALNRKTIDVKYLVCEDIASLLLPFWQSKSYKAANKTEVSLAIKEYGNSIDRPSHNKPYISMSSRREVTASYSTFDETRLYVKLIKNIGLFLTNLRIEPESLTYYMEISGAMKPGELLDCIFEYCPLLKKLEGSFHTLQSYEPHVSTHTSMEELVLWFTEVHPSVLKRFSVQLPNLKRISFLSSAFTKYNGKYVHRKKLQVNMPNTTFDTFYVERAATSNHYYNDMFLKHSNENVARYFYTDFESDINISSVSSRKEYQDKMTSKTTYFLNLRCKAFREVIVRFDTKIIKFLA
ncbi:hypothetical protein HPULCUR_005478 [Helicostylum pulchrum]|uniref:F-box domain-containing protein n=1 Tax=Helicostylum pulchrum TaxID=562976 RepID=A0ABP9XZ60_9FUNG